jgi:hypothetical protein
MLSTKNICPKIQWRIKNVKLCSCDSISEPYDKVPSIDTVCNTKCIDRKSSEGKNLYVSKVKSYKTPGFHNDGSKEWSQCRIGPSAPDPALFVSDPSRRQPKIFCYAWRRWNSALVFFSDADPWYFGVDLDPWIHASDLWIRILLFWVFSSLTFKMPTKN